jgi:K(+)-stimulated pyrophosphate-energized sodium pump
MVASSLIQGKAAFGNDGLIVSVIGAITAVIGIFVVRPRTGNRSGMTAINRGFFVSAVISVILVAIACCIYRAGANRRLGQEHPRHSGSPQGQAIGTVLICLVASAIQLLIWYFTETGRRPVKQIGENSRTGARPL